MAGAWGHGHRGLVEVDTIHARAWAGGSAEGRHSAATILLRPRILEVGMTGEELDRLSGYLHDPRMVVRGLLTISTIGRRPTS